MIKIIISLWAAGIMFFAGVSGVFGTPFKPLSLKEGVVDIPDELVIPVDLKKLELRTTYLIDIGKGILLVINGFGYPGYVFITEDQKEFFPYVEVLRWSIATGEINFYSFLFLNEEGRIEFYGDSESPYEKPTGKFKRIDIPKLKEKVYKLFPQSDRDSLILIKRKEI